MKNLIILLLIIGAIWLIFRNCSGEKEKNTNINGVVEIESLISNAWEYDGEIVKITGYVSGSSNLGFVKFYRIEDQSGESIWVNTEHAVPNDGLLIKVTGRFKQLYKVGEMEMPVIIETEKARLINSH